MTGFWQGGNVQTLIFRTQGEVSYRLPNQWLLRTNNSYVYQAFGRQKADEDLLSLNFLYFNPDRKVYPLLLGFASSNFRRRIDQRYLLGGGVTFQVFKQDDNWLKFSLSSEYEHTDFEVATFNLPEYNGDSTISTFRGTFWINGQYHLLDDKVIFRHESYVQPSWQRWNNFRWRADLSLELPISDYLSFKVNYVHFFENVVIAGQAQDDRVLTFGFTLKNS